MKKFIIIMASIMFVSLISGLIVLGRTGVPFPFGEEEGQLQLKDSKTNPVAGFEKIEIETVSEKINIVKTADPDLKADLKLADSNDDAKLAISPDAAGKTLTIEVDRGNKLTFWAHDFRGELNIYLPQTYSGNLSARTISGSINDSDISGPKNISLESTSGKIAIDDKAGEQEKLTLKTISGAIQGKNLAAFKEIQASSTSGRIELSNLSSNVNAQSVSGRIDLEISNLQKDVKAKSTSGHVNISLPQGTNATFSFSTVSGGLSNKKDLNLMKSTRTYHEGKFGNGGNKIDVETVSGGLSFE